MTLNRFDTIFCDSKEALDEACMQGLQKNAFIYTSSPALLLNSKKYNNIRHLDERWTKEELDQFQISIEWFTKEVFNSVISTHNKDFAMIVGHLALKFQRFIYKAACLNERDLAENRLFIKIDGSLGSLNAPWEELLQGNNNFKIIKYKPSGNWRPLTVKGIPFYKRIYIAGFETGIFKLMGLINPKFLEVLARNFFQNRQLLVVNENELLIETAYNLLKKGATIKKLNLPVVSDSDNVYIDEMNSSWPIIERLLRQRLKRWVMPILVEKCMEIFHKQLDISLRQVSFYKQSFTSELSNSTNMKNILLINAPSSPSGMALTSLCRDLKIPVVAFQHGVSQEICATHGEMMINYESNYADLTVSYNEKATEVYKNSYFSPRDVFTAGMSKRHFRMSASSIKNPPIPIIYISTNLLKGNVGLFVDRTTDYDCSINESNLIANVFSKIPYKVSYKPYPEMKPRYIDEDPILKSISEASNISVFLGKTDMRYSISKYRVLVTSKATSTLGWLVMSGKPTVFINWSKNMPLTNEAYSYFEKGLFLFNVDIDGFDPLLNFLSKPISEIEELWERKMVDRKKMIKLFFSSYLQDSGRRAANIIGKRYWGLN